MIGKKPNEILSLQSENIDFSMRVIMPNNYGEMKWRSRVGFYFPLYLGFARIFLHGNEKMRFISCVLLIFLLLNVSFTLTGFEFSWFPKPVYGSEATSNVVASSDDAEAIYHVAQPKMFYAATRWWMFLDNSSSMVYVTSTDQVNWTPGLASPIHSGGLDVGPRFCVWYNGTHVIYVYTTSAWGDAIYYRIGVPQSDSNISWSINEEAAVPGIAGVGYNYGNVATASTGEVVLAYRKYTDASNIMNIWATVKPSDGGLWTPPVQLSTNGSGTHEMIPKVVPLTGGKLYVLWIQPEVRKTYGEMYYATNASWNVREDVGISLPTTPFFPPTAVNQGDWIYYGGRNSSNYLVFYKRENTWSFNATIDYAPDNLNVPALCINTQTNCTYVFWMNSTQHMYYRIFSGTVFDNVHDWLDETANGFTQYNRLVPMFHDFNNSVGVGFSTGTSSPYVVKFATIPVVRVSDLNGDGVVDILDVLLLSKSFGATSASGNWNWKADLDDSGQIDIFDALILAQNFGRNF